MSSEVHRADAVFIVLQDKLSTELHEIFMAHEPMRPVYVVYCVLLFFFHFLDKFAKISCPIFAAFSCIFM